MLIKIFKGENNMIFDKKKNKNDSIKKFTLTENAILFIKKYAYPHLHTNMIVDEDVLDTIIDLATQWEMDMIDPLSADGCDKMYEYPERERNELADKFVGEITGKWTDGKLIPDFEDINKRLGLI